MSISRTHKDRLDGGLIVAVQALLQSLCERLGIAMPCEGAFPPPGKPWPWGPPPYAVGLGRGAGMRVTEGGGCHFPALGYRVVLR